ncbi:MAG: hypothetical protein ACFFD1_12225 [Candidatus Thorarchaeota archaeon]
MGGLPFVQTSTNYDNISTLTTNLSTGKVLINFNESKATDSDFYGVFFNNTANWNAPNELPDGGSVIFDLFVNSTFNGTTKIIFDIYPQNMSNSQNVEKIFIPDYNGSKKLELKLSKAEVTKIFGNSTTLAINMSVLFSGFLNNGTGNGLVHLEFDNFHIVLGPTSFGLLGSTSHGTDRWSDILYLISDLVTNGILNSLILTIFALFISLGLAIIPKRFQSINRIVPKVLWAIPILFLVPSIFFTSSFSNIGMITFVSVNFNIFITNYLILTLVMFIPLLALPILFLEPVLRKFLKEYFYFKKQDKLVFLDLFIVLSKVFLIILTFLSILWIYLGLIDVGFLSLILYSPFYGLNSFPSFHDFGIDGYILNFFVYQVPLVILISVVFFFGTKKFLSDADSTETPR